MAISREEVTNPKMYDEWFVLVQHICYSASVMALLYQEIATSHRTAMLLAMTW